MSFGGCGRCAGARPRSLFQGALHSLNPVQRIKQIAEPILLHDKTATTRNVDARVGHLLEQVGLPTRLAQAYPHQVSGGQKQRVMIAMAMGCGPRLIIADEPTTALDVMVQAQVLDLLQSIVREVGLGLMIISHDLSAPGTTCDRVAVMYAGRVVEEGPARQVFEEPVHPYTRALSGAFPTIGDPAARYAPRGLAGDPPFPGTCPRAARSTHDAPRPSRSARRRTYGYGRPARAAVEPRACSYRRRQMTAKTPPPTPDARPRGRGTEGHLPQPGGQAGARRRRGRPLGRAGRDHRTRRGVWLRQDDPRPDDPRPGETQRRHGRATPGRPAWNRSTRGSRPTGTRCRWSSRTRAARSTRGTRSTTPSPRGSGSTRCRATSRPSCRGRWPGAVLRPPERYFLRYPRHAVGWAAPARRDRRRARARTRGDRG